MAYSPPSCRQRHKSFLQKSAARRSPLRRQLESECKIQARGDLRTQLLRFAADLQSLAEQVEDSLTVLGSEILMADLAYYQSAREAGRRGRPGAQGIYEDLRSRFPGASPLPAQEKAA